MADEEQLRILKQGCHIFGIYGQQQPHQQLDERRPIRPVDFRGVDLRGADLGRARLHWANIRRANLGGVNLDGAFLRRASLQEAYLSGANLSGADLSGASLDGASLSGADLSGARFFETTVSNVDLSGCKNLDAVEHGGPSSIDIRTLQRSGSLPIVFLRGVGLPDTLIDYLPSLLGQAIQHYSCFISYSSKDDEFVRRLHADLQNSGVRCWLLYRGSPVSRADMQPLQRT